MREYLIRKQYIKNIIWDIILSLVIYLLVAFAVLEANIFEWTTGVRVAFLVCFVIKSIILVLVFWMDFDDTIKKLERDKEYQKSSIKAIYITGGENFPQSFEEWYTDKMYDKYRSSKY